MTARATWEQLFRGERPDTSAPSTSLPEQWVRALAVGEELLTFFLTFLALFAVVTSVERADWVPEMPSLQNTAVVGLITGWLLARTRMSSWWLHLVGIASGVVVVVGMVIRSIRIPPGMPSGTLDRLEELYARNTAWLSALWNGNFSTDPLPFVVMVVIAAWLLAYLAAWSIARWRNPWLALVPGAIALLTNISYLPGQPSAELVVFLFAAILLFARVHLLRTVERWVATEPGAAPPSMLSLEVLNLATWVGIALIIAAWMVPTANHWGPVASIWSAILSPISERVDRVGQLFIGVGSKRSSSLHRFENVLPLQGSVTLGSDPLLVVQVGDNPPDHLYLRGTVYDQYIGSGWKQGPLGERPLPGTTVETASFGTQQTRAQARQPVLGAIAVQESIAPRRLFTFGEPLAASVGARLITGSAPEDLVALEPTTQVDKDDQYQTVGTITAASLDRLLTASPDYPAWVRDRYLQLPEDFPPEIRALAQQIAGDERVPYRVAARVEDYLRSNYAYSLEMGTRPQRDDAVKYFLFDAKRGYSDYFASSMAVMLRSLGVPSRVAVGFVMEMGERDPVTKEFVITDQNSWAWPQVYFPGMGWVDFNPTPSRSLISRTGDQEPEAAPTPSDLDPAPFLDDPGLDEFDVPVEPGADLGDDGPGFGEVLASLGTWLLFAALLFLGGFVAGRFAWNSAFGGLSPATERWAKVQTLAGWAGFSRHRDHTPAEEARALADALARPPIDLAPLARAYAAERYGRGAEESPERIEQLDQLYLRARGRLLKRMLNRLTGFGRRRT